MVREEAMDQTDASAVEEFNVGINHGKTAGQTVLYDLRRSVRNRSSTEPSVSAQLRRTRWIGT
jgi:hypothetical protein